MTATITPRTAMTMPATGLSDEAVLFVVFPLAASRCTRLTASMPWTSA